MCQKLVVSIDYKALTLQNVTEVLYCGGTKSRGGRDEKKDFRDEISVSNL